MPELVLLAKSILGENASPISLVLFILLCLALWAYWHERNKNDKVAQERIKEARDDAETLTDILGDVAETVRDFKEATDGMQSAFEDLADAVKSSKEAKKES